MSWFILIIAGLFEVGFTFCLGKAKEADGLDFYLWGVGFLISLSMSMVLLAKVTQFIPMGTAYPIWTGIGAVGTVIMGIIFFNEPATFLRLLFIVTLIISIIGLKLV
jgi:quaternary ammonium compound-resistance protein SugE